ncbi:4-amino-4-deoxychorismate lyase [Salipaludibacillus neizhouensis]|uniref:4-amino-4-deoxychorismate lyase n=1 Tax=Salipaludibacillus neizhouensis TaxID=885475 RepID=A0A3A9K423_9BACI|nr:aminodeoxychorismate lyase [Salipaludibacillus neizhouensis]RKL65232.1 4-amino-4-deoxychorismate lyase [Salipaludibacillus neizhouensis]
MYLFVDGEFLPAEEVQVSPFDHGFLYGLGLFETFRTYEGHPFLLDDHMKRLHDSAKEMNLKLDTYDRETITKVIEELLRLNELTDGYFRWNVSAGERGIGLSTEEYEKPRTIVYVKPLPSKKKFGKKAQTLTLRRNSAEGSKRLKSHHYLNNILGKRELGDSADAEGIFLTEDGFLSEGVVSNLFWYKDKTLYTPDLTCSCLDGVTRQFLMGLADRAGFSVMEGRYSEAAALCAEEIMVTNSVQEIVAIDKWNDTVFPGVKGVFFQQMQNQYERYVTSLWSKADL